MDFAFYSTDIAPTTDPASAYPAPAILVVLDQPPVFGAYELHGGETGRGSLFQTLGGAVVQDFGVFDKDLRISFSENDALSEATVTALEALHETVDGEYYFTNGYNVWRVRFARPGGFRYQRSQFWAEHGQDVWSYEINLIVISREI